MDNFLAILGINAGALVMAFIVAVFSSERVRKDGLFTTLRRMVSPSDRFQNPYRFR
jgi:hypothetical protein